MPRRGQSPPPEWDHLYRLAAPQGGFFSLGQARAIGYSAPLIEYHRKVGHLERTGRGIFRLHHFPAGDHEDLIVIWLWSERHGVFSHETALALHGLSDVLPAKRHLMVPEDWMKRRLRVPLGVVMHYGDLNARDVTWVGPVAVTSPLRTLVDCTLDQVEPDLVVQARMQALQRGLFSKRELTQALKAAAR